MSFASCVLRTPSPNIDEIGLGSPKFRVRMGIQANGLTHWSLALGWHAGSRGPIH